MSEALKALEEVGLALATGRQWIERRGFDMSKEIAELERALSLLPTLRAALSPATVGDGEIEAIRGRAEWAAQNPDVLSDGRALRIAKAEADRATLLSRVDALASELAKAKQAMRVQASAVKTLQAAEDSEINILRAKSTEAYRATATLDSERAMNATLTEEVERLTVELAAERAKGERMREALEPFSDKAHYWLERDDIHGLDDDDECATEIRFADLRRARAALEGGA